MTSSSSPAPVIDIVIVNWNSGSLLYECVASLDQSDVAERLNVIVIDNASSDNSANALAAKRLHLTVIKNPDNRGFAAANNQGAQTGSAPYLLFLNPDMRVHFDTLSHAMLYLDDPAHGRVGVIGVRLFDSEGHLRRSCARTPSVVTLFLHTLFLDRLLPAFVPQHFLTEWDHGDTRPVDQVMGAFLMIRRSLFVQLGGFDERFFLYYEDVDLCLAARQAGWTVVHLASVAAEHSGGGSTRAVKDRRLFYLANSKVEYTAKRHGKFVAVLLCAFILCFEFPLRWLYTTVACPPGESWLVMRGAFSFLANLPQLARRIWSAK
jgi:N-acetylglucosaminyl-diphospho-decaprenol L-rhamnosyltransferase